MNNYTSLRETAQIEGGFVRVNTDELAALLAEVDQLRATAPAKKTVKKSTVNKVAGPGEGYPEWLPLDAWNAFLDMRKKIKKPATDYAQKLLLKKLAAFYANDLDPSVILNQSIVNGWQDLYAPKEAGRGFGYDVAPGRPGRAPVAEQNRTNNAEALRLLGQPMFADDGMTIEATP